MRAFALAFACAMCLLHGCSPSTPPSNVVYSVSLDTLTRDYHTANTYSRYLIRVRLAPKSYSVVGREIRVAGTVPDTPPLLVFQCRDDPPADYPGIDIIGRCLAPKRDGIFRTAHADFCLRVTDCSVSRSPALDLLGPHP